LASRFKVVGETGAKRPLLFLDDVSQIMDLRRRQAVTAPESPALPHQAGDAAADPRIGLRRKSGLGYMLAYTPQLCVRRLTTTLGNRCEQCVY
jgi:hypothetical protein